MVDCKYLQGVRFVAKPLKLIYQTKQNNKMKNKTEQIAKVKKVRKINEVYFVKNDILFNFQRDTDNSKIGNMIQVWFIPMEWVRAGKMLDDSKVCFDCQHGQSKDKTCYVRDGVSNLGLLSKTRKFTRIQDKLTEYSQEIESNIITMCTGEKVRFGAYGEPILLGEDLVKKITAVSSGWTGYTHQWMHKSTHWASKFFMASVEGKFMNATAKKLGFRTFFVGQTDDADHITCPASKEGGKKTKCDKCTLCSGTEGKGNCNIKILPH